MSKYEPLTTYLSNSEDSIIKLSLDDIEEILECKLSDSMRSYRAMWANSSGYMSKFWKNAGWEVNKVKLDNKQPYIEFVKRNEVISGNTPNIKMVEVPDLIKKLHELYELKIIGENTYTEKLRLLLDKIR